MTGSVGSDIDEIIAQGRLKASQFLRGGKRLENGASEGIRTLDTHVGNVMLYQAELRSLPEREGKLRKNAEICKPDFRPA